MYNTYILYVYNDLIELIIFQSYTDPVRRAIWNKKMSPGGADPNFYSLEEGVKRMQKVI